MRSIIRSGAAAVAALVLAAAVSAVPLTTVAAAAAQARPERGMSPSRSKLSLHLLGGRYTDGAKAVVAERPRVLKIFDLHKDMRDALIDYKTRVPSGVVVLRFWTPVSYPITDNPEQAAERYWNEWIWPPLAAIPESERRLIDYVEGPNEGNNTPTFESDNATRWFSRFWVRLAALMKERGIRPNVGSVAVGNPPSFETRWRLFIPALRAAQQARGSWGYHSYTIEYTQDVGTELWYSLRYRQLVDVIRQEDPELARLPLILTEAGVDFDGNGATAGWQARGTQEKFQQWMAWFDSEIRKDPYVIGATFFQSGDPGLWPSFEMEPVTGWLAGWLRQNR